jgi:Carbohydrate binding module (family 6).
VVGFNSEGDWLEYTINVAEAGEYTFFAAVAAAGSTSSFQMSLDGNPLLKKSVFLPPRLAKRIMTTTTRSLPT